MYFAIGLDEFTEEVFLFLERKQDSRAGHRAAFEGTKEQAKQKVLAALAEFIEPRLYPSDIFGEQIEEVGDDKK